jgi:CBS domain-containing protein
MRSGSVGEFLQTYKNPFALVFVHEDETIADVLKKMILSKEERLVYVVDAKQRLQGIISTGRLVQHLFHEKIAPESGFSPSANILHYLTAEHAKDIMDRDIVYCKKEDSLEEALAKMLGKHSKKVIPVVDDQMHVIDALNVISLMELSLTNT